LFPAHQGYCIEDLRSRYGNTYDMHHQTVEIQTHSQDDDDFDRGPFGYRTFPMTIHEYAQTTTGPSVTRPSLLCHSLASVLNRVCHNVDHDLVCPQNRSRRQACGVGGSASYWSPIKDASHRKRTACWLSSKSMSDTGVVVSSSRVQCATR
jgi:hypothetical protein